MADDMGYSDIGCYGGEIQTPNLNRLAADGLRFSQFYNTGRCCPTRAALLTGLYSHQAGVGHMTGDDRRPGYRGDLNNECLTIAEALKPGGYRTAMSGKWHVTRHVGHWNGNDKLTSKHNWPLQRGFEKFYGTIHGAGSFYDPIGLVDQNEPVEPETEEYYYTDAISKHAADYIREFGEGDKPFFLYVAYTASHWPLHALEEDVVKYHGRYDEGWDALRAERYQRMREMKLVDDDWPLTPRDPRVKPWDEVDNKKWQARRMEVYAAQIDRMDQGIGRIVNALKQTARLDDTLVLFLADNGGCAEEIRAGWGGLHIPKKARDGGPVAIGNNPDVMPGPESNYQSYGLPWANASNTPFRLYKHFVHEGGISTPLIAHWPAAIKQRGNWTDRPAHLVDVMATCIDVAGVEYPKEHNGVRIKSAAGESLRETLVGGKARPRGPIYWEHEGNRAVREGDWKLVSRHPGPWELYNLKADRSELNNLASEQPERVKQLVALYEAWAKRSNVVPWSKLHPPRRKQ